MAKRRDFLESTISKGDVIRALVQLLKSHANGNVVFGRGSGSCMHALFSFLSFGSLRTLINGRACCTVCTGHFSHTTHNFGEFGEFSEVPSAELEVKGSAEGLCLLNNAACHPD